MGCGSCRTGKVIRLDKMPPVKAPTMDSDGSMVFPEGQELPVIDGYKPVADDPQRLSPREENGCRWKITGIMMQRDGSYKPLHVCRNSECEHKQKPVEPSVCVACPFRQP
jgi:hypothetical protein